MAVEAALLRTIILAVGWPVLLVAGAWILVQAWRFRVSVGPRPASGLVVSSMVAWLMTSILLGLTATALMFASPQAGTWFAIPIFIDWVLILALMLHTARRWRAEARAIRMYYDDAESADRLKATVLNRFSHAFATPLTPATMSLSLLKSERLGPLTEQQRHAIQMLVRSHDRMRQMVDDAVQAGQVHGGRVVLQLQPVAMKEMVQALAQEHGVAMARIDDALALVDRERLRPALSSIFAHASQWPGATVTMGAGRDEIQLDISYASAEDATKVFGLFARDEMEVDSDNPLDLGLFTAHGIILRHGGRLQAGRVGEAQQIRIALPTPGGASLAHQMTAIERARA